MTIKQIEPVAVVRDKDGWFSHPQYLSEPEYEDCEGISSQEFFEYLKARGVEYAMSSLEGDDPDANDRYCEDGQADCSAWEPSVPAGEGWFVMSIHDTEDGPVCIWGRKITEQLPGGHYYAADGTFMNPDGTRSIFDDVDQ